MKTSICAILIFISLFIPLSASAAEQKTVRYEGHLKVDSNRPNIAKFIRTSVVYSHQEDFIDRPLSFVPKKQVVIEKVTISVEGVHPKLADFFLGDNCLYSNTTARSEYRIPMAVEIHCTGTSVWNATGYTRSLSFGNDGVGFIIDAFSTLACPVHVALIHPDKLENTAIEKAKVSCEITYSHASSQTTLYKFIRIPYLDQYPDAPHLIDPNVPWYKEWADGTPLKIAGFSLYFNPKPFRDQILKNVCLYTVDATHKRNEKTKVCLPDQIYVAGQTHLQYEPAFVKVDMTINPGESLAGSCDLYKGNAAGDCVLYVLIEIPNHLRDDVKSTPTYYSNGIVNSEYFDEDYCGEDIFKNRLTPLGKKIVRNIGQTQVKSWASDEKNPTPNTDEFNAKNCSRIFID